VSSLGHIASDPDVNGLVVRQASGMLSLTLANLDVIGLGIVACPRHNGLGNVPSSDHARFGSVLGPKHVKENDHPPLTHPRE
jgi:hypothetical protein